MSGSCHSIIPDSIFFFREYVFYEDMHEGGFIDMSTTEREVSTIHYLDMYFIQCRAMADESALMMPRLVIHRINGFQWGLERYSNDPSANETRPFNEVISASNIITTDKK